MMRRRDRLRCCLLRVGDSSARPHPKTEVARGPICGWSISIILRWTPCLSLQLLDCFHVAMRLTVLQQTAKGLPEKTRDEETDYPLRDPILGITA
jgi:hypothetical protein